MAKAHTDCGGQYREAAEILSDMVDIERARNAIGSATNLNRGEEVKDGNGDTQADDS